VGSPLFDHELDDLPSASQTVVDRGKKSAGVGSKASSPPRDAAVVFITNYFLFVLTMALSPLLIPIAALAPRSAVGRFLSRPEPGAKAGLWLGKNYLRLLAICQLGIWLIPIAALAPRALRSRFLERWAGKSLCLYCGFFVLLVLATASEILPAVVTWPYPGIACLLGLSALAADYLRQTRARFRWFQASPRGKGASYLTLVMVALGFEGGTIPPSLRVIVVWGMIGGMIGTITFAVGLTTELRTAPGDDDHQVVVVGEGTVRGGITYVNADGPYNFGTDGRVGHGYASGGSRGPGSEERGWVRFLRGGRAVGEDLTVEMRGRGIDFQGRAALQGWRLANFAFGLGFVLLLVASVTAARGKPIGFVLYATWAVLVLAFTFLMKAWVPESVRLEDWVVILPYPGAILAVLSQPDVRSYLGRSRGSAVSGKPSQVSQPDL
jgi:hypothetical protein